LEALRTHRTEVILVDDCDAWADPNGEFCNLIYIRRAHLIEDAKHFASSTLLQYLFIKWFIEYSSLDKLGYNKT